MQNTDALVLTPTRAEAEAYIKKALPRRAPNSHKGSFGRVHLFSGSRRYAGAALLCAEGALRMGAGLTYLYTSPTAAAAARARLPELIISELPAIAAAGPAVKAALLACEGACVIGPGISQEDDAGTPVDPAHFLSLLRALFASEGGPIVLDADALNLLACATADAASFLRTAKRALILTPHPTEFARLAGEKPATDPAARLAAARAFAKESGATVLLKGSGTVVADPTGRASVNPSGSSALAKGGTGDVLAGMLGALLAQGMPPFAAACAAAYLHGAAGDTLAATRSDYGVLPSELPFAAARELARILEQ